MTKAINKLQRTGYVSEVDAFLRDFNKNRTELPSSVENEIKKHEKIFAKRDRIVEEAPDFIWKDF